MTSTIGADPELLLFSDTLNRFVPSIGLIGGTKQDPFLIPSGALQEDNVTAEFNIDPVPVDTPDKFIQSITDVRKYLDTLVAEFGLKSRVVASAEYTDEDLETPQAQESGCDPDINAYTLERNVYPPIHESSIRCAGGHIHYGSDEIFQDPGSREKFIKYCDYYVGAPLSIIDEDTERRKTYGRAGNFRYKPYGVEYRTPSNIWLKSPELMEFVFNGMKRAENALLLRDPRPLRYADHILQHSISNNKDETYSVLDSSTKEFLRSLA